MQLNHGITPLEFGILEFNKLIASICTMRDTFLESGRSKEHSGTMESSPLGILKSWNLGISGPGILEWNLGMESWNGTLKLNQFILFLYTMCDTYLKLEGIRSTKTQWNQLLLFLESRNLGI